MSKYPCKLITKGLKSAKYLKPGFVEFRHVNICLNFNSIVFHLIA